MMQGDKTETTGIKKAEKRRAPNINPEDFLSAVRLVIEKEGHVNNRLIREHFYREHGKTTIQAHLSALINDGVLEHRGKGFLVFARKPGNGNGSGQERPHVVLPPVKLQAKTPPEPSGGPQPYIELRLMVSRAIERLEDFQERCQPLLAALLDLEKDMEAFERLVTILGDVKSLTKAGLRAIRR